jgi:hypothetical protein
MMKAHRASYEAFKGPIPDGMHVLHQCDVTECVNPDHLFLGTQLDNVRDMMTKGRAKKRGLSGQLNPRSKLTSADIIAIRSATGSDPQIAKEFGVTPSNILAIRHRRTWKHIP